MGDKSYSGIGGLLNLKQGGQNYSYLYDGNGNVTAVLDGTQAVAAAYRYDPFGNLLAKTGNLQQSFGFSTKRYDEQTGLSYYGYRFYSPILGRWLTRDPLGEAGGINLYAFVGNNPVNWVDPWGLVMLICARKTIPWYMRPWNANHVYLYSTVTHTGAGMGGFSGKNYAPLDLVEKPKEDVCVILENPRSYPEEWIMEGFEETKNDEVFFIPGLMDCHSAADGFITAFGLVPTEEIPWRRTGDIPGIPGGWQDKLYRYPSYSEKDFINDLIGGPGIFPVRRSPFIGFISK